MATVVTWIALHLLLVVVLEGGRWFLYARTQCSRDCEAVLTLVFWSALVAEFVCSACTLLFGIISTQTSTWPEIIVLVWLSLLASLLATLGVLLVLVVVWIKNSRLLGSEIHLAICALLLLFCGLLCLSVIGDHIPD